MITVLALIWYGLLDPFVGPILVALLVTIGMAGAMAVMILRGALRSMKKLI